MKKYDEFGLRLVEHPIAELLRPSEPLPAITVIDASSDLIAPVQAFAGGAGMRDGHEPPTAEHAEPPENLNDVVPFPDIEWLAQEKLRLFEPRDRRGIGQQDRWVPLFDTEPFSVINTMRRDGPHVADDDSPWRTFLGGAAFTIIMLLCAFDVLALIYPR